MQRRQHKSEEEDVNLTAVMNIFLILIPFLLLTAVFVKIAVLELSLPNLSRGAAASQKKDPNKSVVLNFLFIRENEFELKSPDIQFSPIDKKDENYDWQALKQQLSRIKQKYPDSEDIIISPEDGIMYDTIITTMDRCREAGFPTISLSG